MAVALDDLKQLEALLAALPSGVATAPGTRGAEVYEATRVAHARAVALNVRNDAGETPLFAAAWLGRPSLVALLLEAGADVSIPDNDGWTPLVAAAYRGHAPVVEQLLKHLIFSPLGVEPPPPPEAGSTKPRDGDGRAPAERSSVSSVASSASRHRPRQVSNSSDVIEDEDETRTSASVQALQLRARMRARSAMRMLQARRAAAERMSSPSDSSAPSGGSHATPPPPPVGLAAATSTAALLPPISLLTRSPSVQGSSPGSSRSDTLDPFEVSERQISASSYRQARELLQQPEFRPLVQEATEALLTAMSHTDSQNWSALLWAAVQGHEAIVSLLVSKFGAFLSGLDAALEAVKSAKVRMLLRRAARSGMQTTHDAVVEHVASLGPETIKRIAHKRKREADPTGAAGDDAAGPAGTAQAVDEEREEHEARAKRQRRLVDMGGGRSGAEDKANNRIPGDDPTG
ncbi:uncharacterized protein AMSG_03367 [Thecamonas trahens ATCC 50062]|uniref:Uncharacterized protein n=1 Tax=Thecamonas trahens ATCC 50062 TaxID=461836 RepID=A0A0L0D3W9_THETB|nr:hypothetical protein AMSG_03367 [Thecamonas trahens ATCC 50062]KNC46935.1 hypothetical protein AMSG_03367 [Thecamonas trahens ATCC 50062]|eukprot:XP_013760207.1 hypothetical protein AMSG_03367 [Thecamonas trahens ATCC 50062]